MVAEVAEVRRGRQRLPHQLGRGRREEHLSTVGGIREPRATIEGRAKIVVALSLDRPGVQSHSHAERADIAPGRPIEIILGPKRRRDGVPGRCERRIDSVADRLEDCAMILLNRLAQNGVMLRDGTAIGLRMPLEKPRRSLDIGEQKGHRA
jgi:hypothetical protein